MVLAAMVRASGPEVVAQKVEAPFGPADECLVRVLLQAQCAQHLVDHPDRPAQLPARGAEHQHVVHEAHVEQAQARHAPVQVVEEEGADQGAQGTAHEMPRS